MGWALALALRAWSTGRAHSGSRRPNNLRAPHHDQDHPGAEDQHAELRELAADLGSSTKERGGQHDATWLPMPPARRSRGCRALVKVKLPADEPWRVARSAAEAASMAPIATPTGLTLSVDLSARHAILRGKASQARRSAAGAAQHEQIGQTPSARSGMRKSPDLGREIEPKNWWNATTPSSRAVERQPKKDGRAAQQAVRPVGQALPVDQDYADHLADRA